MIAELFAAIKRYSDHLESVEDPEELGNELINFRRAADLVELGFSKAAARFAATNEYDRQGSVSAIDWIRHHCNMSGSTAVDRVRVGEQLANVPQSAEAVRSGTIGFGHVSLIARTAETVSGSRTGQPFDEGPVLEQARKNSVGKFWRICQHARHAADQEAVAREQKDAVEARCRRLSPCEEVMVMVGGLLDPIGAATLRTALEPLARRSGQGDTRDHQRRMADALVELATHALDIGEVPDQASQRPHLQVTMSLETLLGLKGAPAAEMEFSSPISFKSVARLACDPTVSRIVLDSGSAVIDVGRARGVVSGSTRRALNARDRGCRWPGCDRPASWSAAHHFVHWVHGGATDLSNLVLLWGLLPNSPEHATITAASILPDVTAGGAALDGLKKVEPKLYLSFSLDAAVPPNHLVRRLAAALDFEFVRALVRQHYSPTGQPSVDPVVLFKLWLLGYLFNIRSERRLCEEASLNLAWRWFLGYELDEPVPDHSVLTKARRRFGTRVYELFFRHIVRLCEARGLVQGDRLFIDSTLSDANAARDTLKSRALVESRLPQPAQFVADLFAVNDPVPEPAPPRQKGGTGPKPSGHAVKPTLRSSLVSTTDPDAEVSTRHHGRSRLVYKTQVLVDGGRANIITAVEVGAAGDWDASSVGKMLDKHHVTLRRPARELVGDSGYGSEAAGRECLARAVQPILNWRRKGHNQRGFSADDFAYQAERDVYICPAGQELHRAADHFTLGRAVYRPKRGTYTACALRSRCTFGVGDRQLQRSWGAEVTDQLRAQMATRYGQRLLRRRQVISERIMADLKSKHGFDRAQFRGRASVQIQALLTAAVVNLKQLLKRSPEAQAGRQLGTDALRQALGWVHAACSRFLSSAASLRLLPT